MLLALATRAAAAEGDGPVFTTTMVAGGAGLPVAVTTGGNAEGPAIVFVHGFMASTLHWQKQMSADLADRFQLVFIDMRGHGSSSKPAAAEHYLDPALFAADIRAAMDFAGTERPLLVGWSYGGLFIMDYLRHYGTDSVSGVVLAGTTAGLLPAPPKAPDTPERLARIERSRSANLQTIQEWTNGFVDFLVRDEPLPEEDVDTLRLSAMLVPHYVRRALRERPTDNTDLVDELDIPVLLVSGSTDVSAKPEDMARVHTLLPATTLLSYEGIGPLTYWYRAARFNRDITDFYDAIR